MSGVHGLANIVLTFDATMKSHSLFKEAAQRIVQRAQMSDCPSPLPQQAVPAYFSVLPLRADARQMSGSDFSSSHPHQPTADSTVTGV